MFDCGFAEPQSDLELSFAEILLEYLSEQQTVVNHDASVVYLLLTEAKIDYL
jgi:hypothetical protein